MIKALVIKLCKRYAVNAVKDAVKAKGEDVSRWARTVKWWLGKARIVTAFLERLADRLADGELTDAEVEATTKEATVLADEVVKPQPEA